MGRVESCMQQCSHAACQQQRDRDRVRHHRRPERRAVAARHGLHRSADRLGRQALPSCWPTRATSSSATTTATAGCRLTSTASLLDIGELFNARIDRRPRCRPCRTRCPTWLPTASAVLDSLGIERAHIVGASMGGMIVQTMAIEHPERLRTVTSIMSMTGEPDYGQAAPEAMAALMRPPPEDRARGHRGIGRGVEDLQQPAVLRRVGGARAGCRRRTTARSTRRVPVARWAPSSRAVIGPTACATSGCRSS